eukprot:449543_1
MPGNMVEPELVKSPRRSQSYSSESRQIQKPQRRSTAPSIRISLDTTNMIPLTRHAQDTTSITADIQSTDDSDTPSFNGLKRLKPVHIFTALASDTDISATGIIDPRSKYKFMFDVLVFIAIVYVAITVPLDIALDVENWSLHSVWFWVSRALDVLFIIDLVLNFYTAIDLGNGGELITDKVQIRKMYLKGWFVTDLVSSIPLDVIIRYAYLTHHENVGVFAGSRLFRVSKFFRVFKILRVSRVQKIKLSDNAALRNQGIKLFWDIGKWVVSLLFLAHWMACIFIIILKEENEPEYTHKILLEPLKRDQYIAALYYTFTYLTTVGFGDLTADTKSQRLFMIFGLTVGSFLTTYFISNVVSVVSIKNISQRNNALLLHKLNSFMNYKSVPSKLQVRIREYIRLMHHNTFPEENMILSVLSPELRRNVVGHIYKNVFDKISFLDILQDDHLFCSHVALKMERHYFAINDLIATKGVIERKLYFIDIGSCKLYEHGRDENSNYKTLNCGDYFGETALLSDAFIRGYYVRAASWCGIITINRHDFFQSLSKYPKVKTRLMTWLLNNHQQRIRHSSLQFQDIEHEIIRCLDQISDHQSREETEDNTYIEYLKTV